MPKDSQQLLAEILRLLTGQQDHPRKAPGKQLRRWLRRLKLILTEQTNETGRPLHQSATATQLTPVDDGAENADKDDLLRNFTLTLKGKSGRAINVRKALSAARWLRALQATAPEHFDSLCKLARQDRTGITQESIDYLKARNYLDPNTSEPAEIYRQVLAAALRDTTDGRVVVNPLLITTDSELSNVQRIERAMDDALRKAIDEDDEPGPPGHGL